MEHFGIHWFRRDLRVAGNLALKWNWKQTQGRTVGVFFFDSKFLSRPDFSNHRFGFFLQTLKSLKAELVELGGDLLVLDCGPDQGFDFIVSKLKLKAPTCITFNRDYEPFARERDRRIVTKLEGYGIAVHTERDHLVIEPDELRKESGDSCFYQVYSPFCKKWASLLEAEDFQSRIGSQKETFSYLEKRRKGEKIQPFFNLKWEHFLPKTEWNDALDRFIQQNKSLLEIELPAAGSAAAYQVAMDFRCKVKGYLENRDFPAKPGTSRLSLYFKNGSITPGIVLSLLDLKSLNFNEKNGETQFLKEIVWREFYYHILYHRPEVENEAFIAQYRDIQWENKESRYQAWMEGKTGYPIVDAGMRELKATGWMHNRVRMIVASFLTKDLLIDWKWGENYFMKQLLDGDLACNNGGWQWAASTGCDPQPYFRIFNPLLQSQKFDPTGDYIRKFVPELRQVTSKEIHQPGSRYIQPIVDHSQQRLKAMALYKR